MATGGRLPSSLHILGSGSIGILFASSIRCALPSFPVTVLLRSGRGHEERITRRRCASGAEYNCINASVIQSCVGSDGISRYSVDIPAEIICSQAHNDEVAQPPIQNLLVATKAPDAVAAVSSVLPRLDRKDGSNIIILSNGAMAIRDEIELVLSKESSIDAGQQSTQLNTKIILASTTHGAYRKADEGVSDTRNSQAYSIVHAGVGSTFVESQSMANLFETAGLRAKYASPDEMNVLLWKKLATNCSINPLTAIHNCNNGELAKMNDETNAVINGIIREVSDVATKDAIDRGLSDETIHELGYEQLLAFVKNVIRETANNKSSMLQDVLAGRETEISYLNGYVARIGREKLADCGCPFNEDMTKRIKGLRS